jgi:hypothetical protein
MTDGCRPQWTYYRVPFTWPRQSVDPNSHVWDIDVHVNFTVRKYCGANRYESAFSLSVERRVGGKSTGVLSEGAG